MSSLLELDDLHVWFDLGEGRELIVEGNALEGLVTDTATARAWTSSSGTGIILGDGVGAGYTIVRRNTLLTPGQVGIQHIDGVELETYENVVLAERRPLNNNPLTSYSGNPVLYAHHNRIHWINNDGGTPGPWFGYGTVTSEANVVDTTLRFDDYRVRFP
jgi:hypothetical protein